MRRMWIICIPTRGSRSRPRRTGRQLTEEIFGEKVVWVPWRRPGFQLGLDIAAIKDANPEAIGCILGGHGITAWGDTSEEAEPNSLWIIDTAAAYIAEHSKAEPFGPALDGYAALPEAERRAKAAALAADPAVDRLGGRADGRPLHRRRAGAGLPGLDRAPPAGRLWARRCPDHFLRTKVKPLVLDLPADASVEDSIARLKELHEAYRADYQAYYDRNATADSPAIRGADPAIILVPGVGMFSYGKNKQTARVAGEFYLNAINVMRGAEGLSDVRADRRGGEVPDRVLGAGGGQAGRGCRSRSRWPPGSRWSPAPPPVSARPSPPASPPRAPAW